MSDGVSDALVKLTQMVQSGFAEQSARTDKIEYQLAQFQEQLSKLESKTSNLEAKVESRRGSRSGSPKPSDSAKLDSKITEKSASSDASISATKSEDFLNNLLSSNKESEFDDDFYSSHVKSVEELLEMSGNMGPNSRPSKSDRSEKANEARRASLFLSAMQQAKSLPLRETVMHTTQPSMEHIKLTKLSIKALFMFREGIVEYLAVNRIQIQAAAYVTTDVRDNVLSRFYGEISLERFLGLSNSHLFLLLQSLVKPTDVNAFVDALTMHARYEAPFGTDKFVPTISNFNVFNVSVLKYKNTFMRLADFLSTNNYDNVPDCNYKDRGLIRIFMDGFPFEFGKRMIQRLISKKEYDPSAKTTLTKFLETFDKAMRELLDVCNAAKTYLDLFGGSELVLRRKTIHSLSAVSSPQLDVDDEEQSPQYGHLEDHYDDLLAIDPKDPHKPPMACFREVFEGACKDRSSCKWSHDRSVVKEARARYSKLLAARATDDRGPQSHAAAGINRDRAPYEPVSARRILTNISQSPVSTTSTGRRQADAADIDDDN